MIVSHVRITAADDYLERRPAHRAAHLERIVELRKRGFVIGGGPSPDGTTADLVYRSPQPGDLKRLVEEDPYWTGGVWTTACLLVLRPPVGCWIVSSRLSPSRQSCTSKCRSP